MEYIFLYTLLYFFYVRPLMIFWGMAVGSLECRDVAKETGITDWKSFSMIIFVGPLPVINLICYVNDMKNVLDKELSVLNNSRRTNVSKFIMVLALKSKGSLRNFLTEGVFETKPFKAWKPRSWRDDE
ncbi:hypothetical protein [Pseudoalteromonas phage J2-1_QLiu-2017]|nr:hypothetical protein [Pseudoalteromonas phage J2-1_QLiu-2017]